jgi:hypothetical protein
MVINVQQGGAPAWVMTIMRVGQALSTILAGPLLTIALSLLYFDLRMRKEGFDLKLMMENLGGGSALASGSPRLDGLGS